MTETENVATYARIRPYNPAINEDKKLTARAADGNKILNMNGDNEDTYNFTKVFDDSNNNDDVFNNAMKPLMDYKILQGINSIFIVYGQSGSGKSFTLIGEEGHLGVLPMSLQYLLNQTDKVQRIDLCSIEAYGIKATKIGFYDLVVQYKERLKVGKNKFDVWATKDNSRVTSANAQTIQITKDNCLKIITVWDYVIYYENILYIVYLRYIGIWNGFDLKKQSIFNINTKNIGIARCITYGTNFEKSSFIKRSYCIFCKN